MKGQVCSRWFWELQLLEFTVSAELRRRYGEGPTKEKSRVHDPQKIEEVAKYVATLAVRRIFILPPALGQRGGAGEAEGGMATQV